ncbi:transglycosylase SLT domain-containing protein [Rhizobium sp. K1/93]|nr:transglycosylase SLT domain-containing protein [Rhizobium sp. L58/93]QXZ87407.1 transglycosylase SLT domain-containing protein [Rhizobium sp. K1/93]QXZ93439.1 transglycosylase SLT domain-containing protein [Rhizobium sp. K15/93]
MAQTAPGGIQSLIASNVPPEMQAYATNLIGKESSFNPSAVSPTGAKGLAQFTKGTGAKYGLISDQGDMRGDPVANIKALVALTNDNRNTLTQALGRPPTDGELALAHQQGAQGAINLLSGKGVSAQNLAVNGVDPNSSPEAAAQKIMRYYGGSAATPAAQAIEQQAPSQGAALGRGNTLAPEGSLAPEEQARLDQMRGPAPASIPYPASGATIGSSGLRGYQDPAITTAYQQPNAQPETAQPMTMAGQNIPGLLSPGNIDLSKRPVVKNPDGSISTVRSISIEQDGKEVLIPTVSPDGRVLTNEDAVKLYRQTGQNLGVFDGQDNADAYAESLHNQQAGMYAPQAAPQLPPPRTIGADPTALQVAQASQAQQPRGPQTLAAGVTPIPRGGASIPLIQSMLRDPNLRQAGLQLWQQNATGKTSDGWDFITLPDGTLARANKQTGAIESVGQFQKPSAPVSVGEGSSLVDPQTGKVVYRGPAKTPQSYQEFQLAQQNGFAGSYADWEKVKQPGVTVNNVPGENSTAKSAGEGLGKIFSTIFDGGQAAKQDKAQIGMLRSSLAQSPTGVLGALASTASDYGINVGPNADQVQVAKAVIAKMVPAQRVPGSGTTSDRDLAQFQAALPRLSGTTAGNATILDTLDALADFKSAQSDIVTRFYAGELDQKGAVKELQSLPDPYSAYKKFVGSGEQPAAATTIKAAPSLGTVEQGYRFKGGDPKLQENWEPAR